MIEREEEAIRFYCGINELNWNRQPTAPGPYACIAPVYGKTRETREINGVCVPTDTKIIQDSGAFSDCADVRLSPGAALDRMIAHGQRYHYDAQVTHRASYDRLIDEQWDAEGRRHKERWGEVEAASAVQETIEAARYLHRNLDRSNGVAAIYSAQGVTAPQYLYCAQQIVQYWKPGDIFGLGGWCIMGKRPKQVYPVFRETMRILIPFLAKEGIDWVHVWGVCYYPALVELRRLCDEHGVSRISCDSASPQTRPVFGRWGYKGWTNKNYQRPALEEMGQARALHVELTRQWLAGLSTDGERQLGLWGEE